MSQLPTAYASQKFGRKSLDFYAVAGDVIGSDARAKLNERRLQGLDGARHTVRLMDADFELQPGHQATVLRLQAGPERASRPVAVINHDESSWSRTHPGANALLSKSGIARNLNWFMSVFLLGLAGFAFAWPYITAFISILAPGIGAQLPSFNVFELALAYVPELSGWSIVATLTPLAQFFETLAPGLGAFVAPGLFGLASFLGALFIFGSRSWRLIWTPIFATLVGLVALGFGGVDAASLPAFSALGIALAVFLIGGGINHAFDAMRLERRIALLADHLIANTHVVEPAGPKLDEPELDEPVSEADPVISESDTLESRDSTLETGDLSHSDDRQDLDPIEPDDAETPAVLDDKAIQADTQQGFDDENSSQLVPQTQTHTDSDADPISADNMSEQYNSDIIDIKTETVLDPDSVSLAPTDNDTLVGGPDETIEVMVDIVSETEYKTDDDCAESLKTTDVPDVISSHDDDENERLKNDPRYAARAIVLPPLPPMPANQNTQDNTQTAPQSQTRPAELLKPDTPLPDNVVPVFGKTDSEPVG